MRVTLPFGEYLPDQAPYTNQGLTKAQNCLPYSNHYIPMSSATAYSTNAIGEVAQGFFSTRDRNGVSYSYAGDISNLYRMASSTFYTATRSTTGSYQTAADDIWEFTKWGERVLATNYANDIQAITLGASNFISLAGTPPKARHIAVVRDFVVLGNVTDISSGSAWTSRVHWSGFDNVETWTPAAATQADYQNLEGDGGWVQRIIGGRMGTIFQERSIWTMQYVGSPVVFQFDEIEPGRGTPAPQSVIKVGNYIYYLGQDDFYRFTGFSEPIGTDRVYRTFINDLDNNYYEKVIAASDPAAPFIFWIYPQVGTNSSGIPNRIIVYNWITNKWAGPINLTFEYLCQVQAEGYTLDGLDAVSTSMDALPYSLDSREWMGGTLNLVGFNDSHELQGLSGSPLRATFETGDRQLFQGFRADINNSRPLIEGLSASVSVAVSSRGRLNETASFGSAVSINIDGECPLLNEGRYHRFRVNADGGFDEAQGIEVEASKRGRY
jgi:hypothetical protein